MDKQVLRNLGDRHLSQAMLSYAEALEQFQLLKSAPSIHNIFQLLLRRDAVDRSFCAATQGLSDINTQLSLAEQSSCLAYLNHLDNYLKQQAEKIVQDGKLEDCRQSRQPAETAWWWYLEPYLPDDTVHRYDRFDWLWNVGSCFCLIIATSFLTATVQAFSVVGGFDILQLFSTLSQATGLALIAGGTLTDKGHRIVKQVLRRLHIPTHFHAEVILGGAVLMLLFSFGMNQSLPLFSTHYYQEGLRAEAQGNLYVAIQHFKEAIAFNTENTEPHTRLAKIYQNLERFVEAEKEYQDGILKGDVEAINGLGTLILAVLEDDAKTGPKDSGIFSELLDAEVVFRIGLEQVHPESYRLRSQLHTNLGITLLKRAIAEREPDEDEPTLIPDSDDDHNFLFADARFHLEEGLKNEKIFKETHVESFAGQSIAYCFLAGLDEYEGKGAEADRHWQLCRDNAYPSAVEQYEDIMRLGGSGVNIHLNTKHILQSGYNNPKYIR